MSKPFVRLAAVALAGTLAVAAAGAAPAMTVADFLGKVDGLKAKGPFALFSPDIGALKREGKAAMGAFYAQAAPPGHPRNACPPAGPIELKQGEFLGFLKAVPPAQRPTVSVADAVTSALNHRFPCSG